MNAPETLDQTLDQMSTEGLTLLKAFLKRKLVKNKIVLPHEMKEDFFQEMPRLEEYKEGIVFVPPNSSVTFPYGDSAASTSHPLKT